MSTVDTGYEKATPTPRDDIPAMLVGYDQVEGFVRKFQDELRERTEELHKCRLLSDRREREMTEIRGLIADALNSWAEGKDDEARQALRDAAARAARQ